MSLLPRSLPEPGASKFLMFKGLYPYGSIVYSFFVVYICDPIR